MSSFEAVSSTLRSLDDDAAVVRLSLLCSPLSHSASLHGSSRLRLCLQHPLSLPLTAAPAPVAADADAEWRDRKKVAPGLLWGVASHEAVEENKPTKKKFYDAITFINILLNNNTVHLFEWVCSFLNRFTFSNNEIAIIKKNLQILS